MENRFLIVRKELALFRKVRDITLADGDWAIPYELKIEELEQRKIVMNRVIKVNKMAPAYDDRFNEILWHLDFIANGSNCYLMRTDSEISLMAMKLYKFLLEFSAEEYIKGKGSLPWEK